MTRVTIVLPYYNVGAYIRQCLDSLQKQTFLDFEVYCVNDGSLDESDEVVLDFVKHDSRFKRFVKLNGGLSDARNYGLQNVFSEYVMFLDSDDFFEPQLLEVLVDKMDTHQCDLVVYNYRQVYMAENRSESIREHFEPNILYNPKIDKSLFAYMSNAAWNKIYRTELFKKYDLKYPVGYRYEDLGTTFRYLLRSERVMFVDRILANYRIDRPNNISSASDIKIMHILDMLRLNHEYFKVEGYFDGYYEELKYLSVINGVNMLRKLGTMFDFKFGFRFICAYFDFIRNWFPDYPKSSYSIEHIANAPIYLYKWRLMIYVSIKMFINRLRRYLK